MQEASKQEVTAMHSLAVYRHFRLLLALTEGLGAVLLILSEKNPQYGILAIINLCLSLLVLILTIKTTWYAYKNQNVLWKTVDRFLNTGEDATQIIGNVKYVVAAFELSIIVAAIYFIGYAVKFNASGLMAAILFFLMIVSWRKGLTARVEDFEE